MKKTVWSYGFYYRTSKITESVAMATRLANRILYVQRLVNEINYCEWFIANQVPVVQSYLAPGGALPLPNLFKAWADGVLNRVHDYPRVLWRHAHLCFLRYRWLRQNQHLPAEVLDRVRAGKVLLEKHTYYLIRDRKEYLENPLGTRVGAYVQRRVAANVAAIFKAHAAYKADPSRFTGRPGFPHLYFDGDLVTIEVDRNNTTVTKGEAACRAVVKRRAGEDYQGKGGAPVPAALWQGQDVAIVIGTSALVKKAHSDFLPVVIPVAGYYSDMICAGGWIWKSKTGRWAWKETGKRFETIKIKTLAPNYYKISICYEKRIRADPAPEPVRVLGIDLGVKVLAALVTNYNWDPLLISSSPARNITRWAVHEVGRLQALMARRCQGCPRPKCWRGCPNVPVLTTAMQRIYAKRARVIDTYFHQVTSWVVQHCLDEGIDTVVVNHNEGQKQDLKEDNKGRAGLTGMYFRKVRRMYELIPYMKLVHQLEYKGEAAGLNVIAREYAWTSAPSALDGDLIPYLKKPQWLPFYCDAAGVEVQGVPPFSGTRTCRGLYAHPDGSSLHADVNNALNLLRKELGDGFLATFQGKRLPPPHYVDL